MHLSSMKISTELSCRFRLLLLPVVIILLPQLLLQTSMFKDGDHQCVMVTN
ncbi:hypothetical protein CsatA_012227 [Cannabis sativa]